MPKIAINFKFGAKIDFRKYYLKIAKLCQKLCDLDDLNYFSNLRKFFYVSGMGKAINFIFDVEIEVK